MGNRQAASSQIDRIIFALRWLFLLGALVLALMAPDSSSEALGTPLPSGLLIVIFLGAVYNLLVAMVLWLGAPQAWFGGITLMLDGVLSAATFWAAGADPMVMVGAGLLPVVTASVRFGWPVGVGVSFAVSLADVFIYFLTVPNGADDMASVVAGILFLLFAASLSGLLTTYTQGVLKRMVERSREVEARRLRAARERTRAIYEMASTLSATLDYKKVLDAALDVGVLGLRELRRDARLVGMVLLFRDNELYVATARRLTRRDMAIKVPGKRGIMGMALRQAEPVIGSDPRKDPELRYFMAFQGVKSVLCIPLRAGYDNYGLLVFGSEKPNAFSGEHVELLTAIGSQATIALQNAVLYQNLKEEKERIVEVEEDARKKLARDLHDGPTQGISAVAMRINFIRRLLERHPEQVPEELWKVEELARRTTKEIRHMLFTLRPLVLETQGLTAALEQLAQKMRETHGQNVVVHVRPGVERLLSPTAQGVVFYIVEEAVNNARKHAQADHIWVRLYRQDEFVVLEVEDDGVGFDVKEVDSGYEHRGSLGMINMRERAELVEGTTYIESEPGKGTKITVLLPISEEDEGPEESGSRDGRGVSGAGGAGGSEG